MKHEDTFILKRSEMIDHSKLGLACFFVFFFKMVPVFHDLPFSRRAHSFELTNLNTRIVRVTHRPAYSKKRAFMAALERCYQRCPSQIQRDPGAVPSPMI